MVIFLGASSGAVLGKLTVRTPFSIAALISSSCKHVSQLRPNYFNAGRSAYLDTLRKLERPRELAKATLANSVAVLIVLARLLRLRRDGQSAILHVDVDVLLGHARELEGGCYEVLLVILVEVHSNGAVSNLRQAY